MAEVVGVTVDQKDTSSWPTEAPPLLEFNADGTFVRSIADGLPLFEGPTACDRPQRNLLVRRRGDHLVVKFDQTKTPAMVLGRRPEPWTWMTHVIERAIPGPRTSISRPTFTWGPTAASTSLMGNGNFASRSSTRTAIS